MTPAPELAPIPLRGFEAAWVSRAIVERAQHSTPPPGAIALAHALADKTRHNPTKPDVELLVAEAGWFDEPMSYDTAARALGCSRRTVERMAARGVLRTVLAGARPRIPRAEIDRHRRGVPG